MKTILLTVANLLLVLLLPVFADTLYLNNGNRINGDIIEEKEDYVIIEAYGGTVRFERSEIKSIDKETKTGQKDLQKEMERQQRLREIEGFINSKNWWDGIVKIDYFPNKGLLEIEANVKMAWNASSTRTSFEYDSGRAVEEIFKSFPRVSLIRITLYGELVNKFGNEVRTKIFKVIAPREISDEINYDNLGRNAAIRLFNPWYYPAFY